MKSGDYLHLQYLLFRIREFPCARALLDSRVMFSFSFYQSRILHPIKRVAKSKLAVNRGSFLAKFCHLSWVCLQYPNPGLGTGFSVLQKWPGLSLMLTFETSGTASLCNWTVSQGQLPRHCIHLPWHLSSSLDHVHRSWILLVLKNPSLSEFGHFGQKSKEVSIRAAQFICISPASRLGFFPPKGDWFITLVLLCTSALLLWIFLGAAPKQKSNVILQHASTLGSFLVLVDVEGSERQRWFLGALRKKECAL